MHELGVHARSRPASCRSSQGGTRPLRGRSGCSLGRPRSSRRGASSTSATYAGGRMTPTLAATRKPKTRTASDSLRPRRTSFDSGRTAKTRFTVFVHCSEASFPRMHRGLRDNPDLGDRPSRLIWRCAFAVRACLQSRQVCCQQRRYPCVRTRVKALSPNPASACSSLQSRFVRDAGCFRLLQFATARVAGILILQMRVRVPPGP